MFWETHPNAEVQLKIWYYEWPRSLKSALQNTPLIKINKFPEEWKILNEIPFLSGLFLLD